ncbi:MAG: hypothetical protein Q8L69_05795, partial [Gallionellaceae bacterium]|nr:hypothetical protein [Gallionellaceae bacterium]
RSMSKQNGMMKRIAKLGMILMLGASMSACAGFLGLGGDSWKEEVLLHDGSKIIVERTADRHGRHEIGQRPPIGDQSISFTMPGSNQHIVWKDEFSEDVGGANFNLMMLEVVQNTAYLLATPAGCLSYNKWGRPNPPYVVFKHDGKEWQRSPLHELPVEIKQPNMLHSSPDDVAGKSAKGGVVSADVIRRENDEFRQPEFRTILREAVAGAGGGCIKTDYYKGYGWLSPDWFSDQPSLEACLKFCDQKKFAKEVCPCNKFFKGEK